MLDRLASGGLVTVILITLLALGYTRVLRASRKIYLMVAALVVVAIVGSQFLPTGNIFRDSIAEDFTHIGIALLWISPVLVYGLLIWWIRRKVRAREGNDGS